MYMYMFIHHAKCVGIPQLLSSGASVNKVASAGVWSEAVHRFPSPYSYIICRFVEQHTMVADCGTIGMDAIKYFLFWVGIPLPLHLECSFSTLFLLLLTFF